MKNKKLYWLMNLIVITTILCFSCADLLNKQFDLGHSDNQYGTINWSYNAVTFTLSIEGTCDVSNPFSYRNISGLQLDNVFTIELGSSITALDDYAFEGFKNLRFIDIPITVTSAGKYIFNNLNTEVLCQSNTYNWNPYWFIGFIGTMNGVQMLIDKCYNNDKTACVIVYDNIFLNTNFILFFGGTGDVVWPINIWSNFYYKFYDAYTNTSNIKEIIVHKGITSLSTYNDYLMQSDPIIFWGLSSLESVTLPNTFTSLNDYMFYQCTSLSSITIPSSVTTIEYGAFEECTSLSSITIPSSVTTIEGNAFAGWTSSQTINLDWSSTGTTERNLPGLSDSNTNATIYYNDGVLFS